MGKAIPLKARLGYIDLIYWDSMGMSSSAKDWRRARRRLISSATSYTWVSNVQVPRQPFNGLQDMRTHKHHELGSCKAGCRIKTISWKSGSLGTTNFIMIPGVKSHLSTVHITCMYCFRGSMDTSPRRTFILMNPKYLRSNHPSFPIWHASASTLFWT